MNVTLSKIPEDTFSRDVAHLMENWRNHPLIIMKFQPWEEIAVFTVTRPTLSKKPDCKLSSTFSKTIFTKQNRNWYLALKVQRFQKFSVIVAFCFLYEKQNLCCWSILRANMCISVVWVEKRVAQRATIAHLSPMCQGQISFQKIRTHPSFNACSCYMKVSKGSNQKQQRKSGNTIFPIISLCGYFLDAQGQLTP